VIEGMPGAGKTTIATGLTARGHRVLGEYTAPSAATLPVAGHPPVAADDAHQANWLRKSRQAARALSEQTGPVFADRDWLSSLAYAYSIADTDDGLLLIQRAAWAAAHLSAGDLMPGNFYMVLHASVPVSLRRRRGHLRAGHPWSHPPSLRRLQAFYRHPVQILNRHAPQVAQHLGDVRWIHLPPLSTLDDALLAACTLGATP